MARTARCRAPPSGIVRSPASASREPRIRKSTSASKSPLHPIGTAVCPRAASRSRAFTAVLDPAVNRIAEAVHSPKRSAITHKHRRVIRGVAAAFIVCAAVPVDQLFLHQEGEPVELRSADTTRIPVRVVKVRADAAFDWGDAGTGAIGALALTAIGPGGALALRRGAGRRHMPQPIPSSR